MEVLEYLQDFLGCGKCWGCSVWGMGKLLHASVSEWTVGSVGAAPQRGLHHPVLCGPLLDVVTSTVSKVMQPFSTEFLDNHVSCGVVSRQL